MKKTLLFLAIPLFCFLGYLPVNAAAKFDESLNSVYRHDFHPGKKRQNRGFFKRAWLTVFPKKQLRQKNSAGAGRFKFGLAALVAVSLAAVALFVHQFWALAIIAWSACLVLGIIGLFKDDSKALAIIALSLSPVLPVILAILFHLNCCGP